MKKLNLGCGNDIRDGWDNIDLYSDNSAVLKYDVRSLEGYYNSSSIDEIYASDVIEHISHTIVDGVLASWCNLLKKGGKITIKCPDPYKHARLLIEGVWDVDIYRYMVFGGQDSKGNFHHTCYDISSITKILEKNSVCVISREYIHNGITNHKETSNNANIKVVGVKG